jgi:hypothetical protein
MRVSFSRLLGGSVIRWRILEDVKDVSFVDMSVPRVRQLRDAQKSGGTQPADISSVNRR